MHQGVEPVIARNYIIEQSENQPHSLMDNLMSLPSPHLSTRIILLHLCPCPLFHLSIPPSTHPSIHLPLLTATFPPFHPSCYTPATSSSTLPVNISNELGPVEELALPANETSVTLLNLKYSTRYKFYFNAKTGQGAGPVVTEEAATIMDEGKC